MTDKELIKQEIEILYAEVSQRPYNGEVEGEMCAYDKLISFIDSLPEEPDCEKKDYCERYEKLTQSDTFKSSYCDKSLGKEESTDEANCITKSEDLEEAADKYAENHGFRVPYDGSNKFYDDVDVKASKEGFIAGAEWQKDKMNLLLQTEYEKGLFDMNEAMMKDAVELHIVESFNPVGTENEKPHGFTALCYNAKYPDFYPVTGQTIKVVPIKEIQNNEQDCRKKGIGSISKR